MHHQRNHEVIIICGKLDGEITVSRLLALLSIKWWQVHGSLAGDVAEARGSEMDRGGVRAGKR
jgi:hypothetical protein